MSRIVWDVLNSGAPFVVSLGGGVQSTVIVARGIKEGWNIAAVVFADTGEEQDHTWAVVRHLESMCQEAGIPFAIVQGHDGQPLVDWYKDLEAIPYVTKRSCTDHFKIRPVRAWLTENGFRPCTVALGITTDEAHRARDSDREWCPNAYPLLDLGMSRADCKAWLDEHWDGPPVKKSGCKGCPMHGRKGYAALLRDDPAEFARWEAMEANGRNYGTKKHHTLLPAGPTLATLREAIEQQSTLVEFDDSDVAGLCAGGCLL